MCNVTRLETLSAPRAVHKTPLQEKKKKKICQSKMQKVENLSGLLWFCDIEKWDFSYLYVF